MDNEMEKDVDLEMEIRCIYECIGMIANIVASWYDYV